MLGGVFLFGLVYAADLNYDIKTIDVSKLLNYPTMPTQAEKIGNKDATKAANKFTINHSAKMGGAGGVFSDILVRGLTDASSGFSGNYYVSVRYAHWDTSAVVIAREVNSKMLTSEERQAMINEITEKLTNYERFFVGMSYPTRWAGDANLDNWKVIMFDSNGNRYNPVKIESESIVSDAILVEKQETHKTYVSNLYTIYFQKLEGRQDKIELVLAGGASEDKKLGFRWDFDYSKVKKEKPILSDMGPFPSKEVE